MVPVPEEVIRDARVNNYQVLLCNVVCSSIVKLDKRYNYFSGDKNTFGLYWTQLFSFHLPCHQRQSS